MGCVKLLLNSGTLEGMFKLVVPNPVAGLGVGKATPGLPVGFGLVLVYPGPPDLRFIGSAIFSKANWEPTRYADTIESIVYSHCLGVNNLGALVAGAKLF